MDRIRFACSECEANLTVNATLGGKPIACPKCRAKNTVPAPETEEELAAPTMRFPCTKCGAKLKVPVKLAGRAITCPTCQQNTLVPDEEDSGSYGLAGAGAAEDDDPIPQDRPLDEWWPDGDALDLPASTSSKLATARTHTEDERWTKALGILNELFQKELRSKTKIGTSYLRKPLAYCLVRWAAREIDRIDEAKLKPSRPVRQVLKKAAEMQRWGASLSNTDCPLCGRQLRNLIGTTQIRTVAGSAYVCCARPTSQDDELVRHVDRINKKLLLATSLDPDNRHVPLALKHLPDWYRAVDMNSSVWTRPIVDDDEGRESPGSVGGSLAGNIAGNIIGEVLSNLLG